MNANTFSAHDRTLTAQVERVWRANGIARSTIRMYRQWIRRFHRYCLLRGQRPEEQLQRQHIRGWMTHYVRARGKGPLRSPHSAHCALWAWSWGLEACGYTVPPWCTPAAPPVLPPLLEAFRRHRREVQGVAESSARRDLAIVQELLAFLRHRGCTVKTIQVADIDGFVGYCRRRIVPKTLASVATALRAFLGYLYLTDRLKRNLAMMVASPRVVRGDTPPRALAWTDVRRILRAINRKSRIGLRDYALLLMMAAYGLGAGEVRSLTLESVDWRRRELHVLRPKTCRRFDLPLLPAVGQALAAYLRRGRPRYCTTRILFVRVRAPYSGLGSSGAFRHILGKHAAAAGVTAAFLGSHVLRHSHACRQIDLGQPAAVVGDILGHRRPESTSAYVRVALTRLRRMALPVPT